MLDLAGVLPGDGFIHTQGDKELCQGEVAVIGAAGNGITLIRQGNQAALLHGDVAVFPQLFHGDADGRLGHAKGLGNISGTGIALFFQQNQNLLQIILSRFVNIHCNPSFRWIILDKSIFPNFIITYML